MPEHHHAFSDWPFADSVNTVTFCTDKVAHEAFPVLQVAHDHNGDWQFLDATTDTPGDCVLLCMGCVFDRDASLAEISDLPRGWSAYPDGACGFTKAQSLVLTRSFSPAPPACFLGKHTPTPGSNNGSLCWPKSSTRSGPDIYLINFLTPTLSDLKVISL